MMERTDKHTRVNIIILLLSAILIIGGVAVRPLMYMAFLFVFGYVLLNIRNDNSFTLMFFLMPVATVFKLSAGSISLYTYIQLVLEIILIIRNHNRFSKKFFLFYFLYAGYVFVGIGTSITDGVKQIFWPILVYFCLRPEYNYAKEKYAESYALGVILSSVTGWLMNYIPNMTNFVTTKTEHVAGGLSYSRFAGLWGDPNYYCVNVILAFTLVMYFHIKGKIPTLHATIYYACLIVFGAISGSKMFLFMIVLVLIWFIIELFKNRKYGLGFLFILIGIVGIILVLNGTISVFDTAIQRLLRNNSSLSGITTYRSDLWLQYISEFFSRPIKFLVGNGIGTAYTFTAPHNTYIDYLDFYGILGTAIFVLMLHYALYTYPKAKKLLNYLPLIALLICWFALSMIRYLDFGWQMTLALLIVFDTNPIYIREEVQNG